MQECPERELRHPPLGVEGEAPTEEAEAGLLPAPVGAVLEGLLQ